MNRHYIRSMEQYHVVYEKSVMNPSEFWGDVASDFRWQQPYTRVTSGNFADDNVRWFEGGKINMSENALDRHLATLGDKTAIIFEPNDPTQPNQYITYRQLYVEVNIFANVLKAKGVQKGDRVCIYMPMVPQAAVAMLACSRVGAIHSVVFGGFSAQSLADRINDATCKVLITADGGFRGDKTIALKEIADQALQHTPSIESVIVLQNTHQLIQMQSGRDTFWHDETEKVTADCPPTPMDSEDPLFILYTSGSTGKPKGVVHSTAGYMAHVYYTFLNIFQLADNDIFWCTADVGWVTGHSYIVYAPLLAGATVVMFEGVPNYPDYGRFWQVVDKLQVTHLYTAPTAIRALQAAGLEYVKPYRLDSLKLLGSVGEPINEAAWQWYYDNIGRGRCPIVDTWWQTETGGALISPLCDVTPLKPTMATLPLMGVVPVLLDANGNEIEGNEVEGLLCIKHPFPSIIRTTYGDHQRCRDTYFNVFKGYYFTGDGARRDADGYYRIIGRVDDVINVSGHRIGTAEVENAINLFPQVIESAVVGYPHDIKGQGIYAFVICEGDTSDVAKIEKGIRETVTKQIGAIAKPDLIQIVAGLPKTRSGKIMRRILRKIAEGDVSNLGDTATLLDPSVVEAIIRDAPTLKG